MTSNEFKAKLTYYYNLRNELKNKNIEEEVNIRLENERDNVRNKVIAEVNADIDKCTHYIDLLDILVKEQVDKEEAEANENVDKQMHYTELLDELVKEQVDKKEAENNGELLLNTSTDNELSNDDINTITNIKEVE